MANLKPQIPLISEGDYIYPLTTIDQVLLEDGTKANQALVTKDYVNNIIPFSLGIDENGNYGYIKAGADTVTPFKGAPDFGITDDSTAKFAGNGATKTLSVNLDAGTYIITATAAVGVSSSIPIEITGCTVTTLFSESALGSGNTANTYDRVAVFHTTLADATTISVKFTVSSSSSYGAIFRVIPVKVS